MATPDPIPRAQGLRTSRMEAFSDGVLAIAITLLVLDIAVPSDAGDLFDAVVAEWPSYLAYLVSFATIGAVWLEHSVITEFLQRANGVLVRLNLLLLLVVSFLPFPTRLLAEHLGEDDAARVAVTVYGVNLLLISVLVSVLWRYAVAERLIRGDVSDADVRLLTRRLGPGIGGYAVMIVVGLFVPVVATMAYFAIAVYFILPVGAFRRRTTRNDVTHSA